MSLAIEQLLDYDNDIERFGGFGDVDSGPHLRDFMLMGSALEHGGQENDYRLSFPGKARYF